MENIWDTTQLPLTMEEITNTANFTVQALKTLGYRSYVFGSAACALYGLIDRIPHDVDIVVLPNSSHDTIEDIEVIKRRIVFHSDHFILKRSRNPNNTYQILHFQVIAPHFSSIFRTWQPEKLCKVDIISPGTIGAPFMPPEALLSRRGIPLAPFKTLVLLKLFGWYERRVDYRESYRIKAQQDDVDIDHLLQFIVKPESLNFVVAGGWCPPGLQERARVWVSEYIRKGLRHAEVVVEPWRLLDYDVERSVERLEISPFHGIQRVWFWVVK